MKNTSKQISALFQLITTILIKVNTTSVPVIYMKSKNGSVFIHGGSVERSIKGEQVVDFSEQWILG